MARDTSLVYAEIAQSLIGMASNFTLEDQRSFWECRYNSAEEMVAERLAGKGEDAIGNAIRFGYFEALIVILGGEGIAPFASYVLEHMLEYAKSEFPGFKDAHERAMTFFAQNWDVSNSSSRDPLAVIANWMNHELLKQPNDIAQDTFLKRIRRLKVSCFAEMDEYLSIAERIEE